MERKRRDMKMDIANILPEVCLSRILSLTSAKDACRSSAVSPIFRSAANSDSVWESFLPSDYQHIISNSSLPSDTMSKKELYFHLCNNPIIIENGTMSFALDKWSGKKCYMLGARRLSITWGDQPDHWTWTSRPESRFSEVAELMSISMIGFKGKIETKILSTKQTYAVYLVFKFTKYRYGFKECHVNLYIKFKEEEATTRGVFLDPPDQPYGDGRDGWFRYQLRGDRRDGWFLDPPDELCGDRRDGWMEIEMGEFYNGEEDGVLDCSVWEIDNWVTKNGLIIEGFEVRPKPCL